MYKYLINKDTNIFFTTVTRDIYIDNNLFELIETEIIIDDNLIIPTWNGTEWIEGASNDYLRNLNEEKAIQIDLEYTAKISLLMKKHVEKYLIDGTQIPENIIEKRNDLRQECNDKISELGISDFTYRQRIIGL